jgi:hypothetical protein
MSPVEITEPGVYDLPDEVYHGDPVPGGSLSASGAKLLLPPSCPAKFQHEREHGRQPRKVWDIGHAAHRMVLGAGPELVPVVDEDGKNPDEWRTKRCRDLVAEIRQRGAVPLKRAELDQVTQMAEQLRRHEVARALFDPSTGDAEQSLFWRDLADGVWLRARVDFLRHKAPGRLVIPDYKTVECADPGVFGRDAARYGYHIQEAWYTAAARELLGVDAAFVFVLQEKTPPYVVSVVELDPEAKRAGARLMRRAIEIYRDCAESGVWPGYTTPDEIRQISLPAYATRDTEEW